MTDEEKIRELELQLKLANTRIEDLELVLGAIPECLAHGKCIPHAIEWIEQVKTLSRVIVSRI